MQKCDHTGSAIKRGQSREQRRGGRGNKKTQDIGRAVGFEKTGTSILLLYNTSAFSTGRAAPGQRVVVVPPGPHNAVVSTRRQQALVRVPLCGIHRPGTGAQRLDDTAGVHVPNVEQAVFGAANDQAGTAPMSIQPGAKQKRAVRVHKNERVHTGATR